MYANDCPVEITADVIGGRWKPMIVFFLETGTHRFGELHKLIPATTKKMLTQQLRELERDEIVRRKVFAQVPPKVEYSLTAYGRTLRTITDLMCKWGETHLRRSKRSAG